MRKKRKGFTLVEVLFSAAIIALVTAGVIGTLVNTIDISKRVKYEYTATNLAKSRLERARTVIGSNGFYALPDLNETDTVIKADGAADSDGNFKRSTSVTENYNGSSRLTQVDVKVTYKYRNEWRESATTEATTVFVNTG